MGLVSYCGFDLYFLMASKVEHFHISLDHLYVFIGDMYIQFLSPFSGILLVEFYFIFLPLSCVSYLGILCISCSLDIWFTNSFSCSVGCLFTLLFTLDFIF